MAEAKTPARAYARACLKNVRVFKLIQNADLVKQTEEVMRGELSL